MDEIKNVNVNFSLFRSNGPRPIQAHSPADVTNGIDTYILEKVTSYDERWWVRFFDRWKYNKIYCLAINHCASLDVVHSLDALKKDLQAMHSVRGGNVPDDLLLPLRFKMYNSMILQTDSSSMGIRIQYNKSFKGKRASRQSSPCISVALSTPLIVFVLWVLSIIPLLLIPISTVEDCGLPGDCPLLQETLCYDKECTPGVRDLRFSTGAIIAITTTIIFTVPIWWIFLRAKPGKEILFRLSPADFSQRFGIIYEDYARLLLERQQQNPVKSSIISTREYLHLRKLYRQAMLDGHVPQELHHSEKYKPIETETSMDVVGSSSSSFASGTLSLVELATYDPETPERNEQTITIPTSNANLH